MLSKIFIGAGILLITLTPLPAKAISLVANSNARDLVNTLLGANSGITVVGTPTYIGSPLAVGTFTGGNTGTNIGVDDGIVLSTGDLNNIPGSFNKNDVRDTTFNLPGDPNLNALVPGSVTVDAAVLSFNFTSSTNDLYLQRYIFASQEYPTFVNSQYNDVFGYFVDGVNIANVPGTNQPVTINNINNGPNNSGVQATNPQLYINNTNNGAGIQVGGLTVPLTASLTNLAPGVHSFKLAIADVQDFSYDSMVFLKGGSFSAVPVGGVVPVPTSVPEPAGFLGILAGLPLVLAMWKNIKRSARKQAVDSLTN